MKLTQKLQQLRYIFFFKSSSSSSSSSSLVSSCRLKHHPSILCFSSSLSQSSSSIGDDDDDDDGGDTKEALSEQELITQMNLIIPRLCSSNQLKQAANLITTALLTNPPLQSLPLSIFIHTLSLQPDLTLPMYFLNRLKHSNPQSSFTPLPFARMLVSSFFEKGQPRKAFKIFQWVSRPDFSPSHNDDLSCFYGDLVGGFCRNCMVLEGLKVLKVMVEKDLMIGDEVRMCVYRGLLREARIKEAQLLIIKETALEKLEVLKLLDDMIANWVD